MKQPKASSLRVNAQLGAEKQLRRSATPLSDAVLREMVDRDPNFDRVDAGVDRQN